MNPIISSLATRMPNLVGAPQVSAAGPAPQQPTLVDNFVSGVKSFDYKMAAVNTAVGAGCMAIAGAAGATVAGQIALAIVPAAIAFAVAQAIRGAREGGKGGGNFVGLGEALGGMFGALKGACEGLVKAPLIYGATVGLASIPAVASLGLPAAAIGGGVGLALWGGTQVAKHLMRRD